MLIGGRAHSLDDIAAIGEIHLPFAEISLTDPEQVEKDFYHLCRFREECRLFYLAHGPEEGNPWDIAELRKSLLPKVNALIKWVHRLDITLFTIHFWLDERFIQKEIIVQKIALLKEMVKYASSEGVMLSIENLSESAEDFSLTFEEIPDLGFTLDIGHGELLTEKNTAYEFIKRYPKRIKHVHAHDNRGGDSPIDDLHLPIGKGIIDYSSILASLTETGYDRTITLEIDRSDLLHGKKEIERMIIKGI